MKMLTVSTVISLLMLLAEAKSRGNQITMDRGDCVRSHLPDDPIVEIVEVRMNPRVVTIPGRFSIQVEYILKQDLINETIALSLDLQKRFNLLFGLHTWMKIPCMESTGVGSCTYEDMCSIQTFIDSDCFDVQDGSPSSCECSNYKKGHYRLKPIWIDLQELPDIPDYLLGGQFWFEASIKRRDRIVGCHAINVKLDLF